MHLLLSSLAIAVVAARVGAADSKAVNYSRDVQPIFTAHCYACHGPDEGKRKAKLRLDQRESAIRKAIKPGDAPHSPLIQRVVSEEADQVMPPPASKKERLSTAQVELLAAGSIRERSSTSTGPM